VSKDAWIAAHNELIDEYMEAHPDADWTEAYEKTADHANDRARDKLADLIDEARDRAKYA
jgi:hypothetical protein